MNKKELEKLRALPATPAMIEALKRSGKRHKYYYKTAARCQCLDGILKVSICTRKDIEAGDKTPRYDLFINYEGDSYITRERQPDGSYKWRTAMIHNLDETDYWCSDYDKYMYMNAEGKRSVRALLHAEDGSSYGIMSWQQGCRKRWEDKKIKERTDRWNAVMKQVKDFPAGFENWWKHNGFDGDNYIYYTGAGAETGYCTSCLKEVKLIDKPLHNYKDRCPVCRKRVTFISRAKKKVPIWTYERSTGCIQRYKDGLIERQVSIRRCDSFKNGKTQIKFFATEYRRTIFTEGKPQTYRWDDYKRRGYTWCQTDVDYHYPSREIENIYPKNITAVLKKYHTAYPIAVKNGHRMSLSYFLYQEAEHPAIELAYKAGLLRLGREMINGMYRLKLDEAQTELGKILKIDKNRINRLKQMDGGIIELMWLQDEKKQNTQYAEEDIKTMCRAGVEPFDFRKSEAGEYLSLKKCCNYIAKQKEYRKSVMAAGLTLKTVWRDWNDYINMLKKLKMDCSKEILLKPKDLTMEHNKLVAAFSLKNSEKEIREKEKKFKNAKKLLESGELQKYEYEDNKYAIVAPRSIKDIYEEGLTLKHCIHTCDIYFQRIDIRETYLLFLRRKDEKDKPWYTLEIEPGGNIRQKKSVLNEAYKDLDDALPFLKKWQKWVEKNLSKKDRELAEKSNKARIDGYKQLREEKKIIWHGRLQGTLLADALESDFMAVV